MELVNCYNKRAEVELKNVQMKDFVHLQTTVGASQGQRRVLVLVRNVVDVTLILQQDFTDIHMTSSTCQNQRCQACTPQTHQRQHRQSPTQAQITDVTSQYMQRRYPHTPLTSDIDITTGLGHTTCTQTINRRQNMHKMHAVKLETNI